MLVSGPLFLWQLLILNFQSQLGQIPGEEEISLGGGGGGGGGGISPDVYTMQLLHSHTSA